MVINRSATAGTFESGDVFVFVDACENGIELIIESIVYKQYGEEIEKTVRKVLRDFSISNIRIELKDRGALEYVICSRVETAIKRAGGVIL